MIWWDFTNGPFIALFIVMIIIILCICGAIITFIISMYVNNGYRENIKAQSNTVRIYVLNVKRSRFTYFNRSELRHRRTKAIEDFYAHFKEGNKVKHWVMAICLNNGSASTYLEAEIHVKHKNMDYYSLLKLNKYNQDKGLIYIESHLLKYIAVKAAPIKKVKGMVVGVLKRSDMANIINNSIDSDGYTFAIRFFYKHQGALQSEDIERYSLMTLKNEVYPFLYNPTSPRQILEPNNNELYLFDCLIRNRDAAMALASNIAHNLNRSLAVNSFEEAIGFSIGIVENRLFYRSFDTIIEQAKNACIQAQQDNKQVVFARYSTRGNIDMNKFSHDIDHLLKPGTARYLFRPLVNLNNKKNPLYGYFSYVRPYNSPFTSIQEMSKYASRVNKGRELFASIAKNIIPKFASESKFTKLFYSVSLYDVEYIFSVLPQINRVREVDLVLLFQEQEIQDNSTNLEELHFTFKRLKAEGYELAISLEDKDLLLETTLYEYFDYYVTGASMLGEIRRNNRIRLSIHTLVERLLKYNKPVIASDLEGWSSIELVIKAGITYLSSETISPNTDMLLPVDSKKMDKLHLLVDKYLR